jgi:pimeloyl-ACP methyl ester carboxylesterase
MASDLRSNPDSDPMAAAPRIARQAVNGTTLYVEVRGTGPAVLLIPGGAEDAEGWRPVAERLRGHTVVTYDRRGTLRSGREGWPGRGSAQHADDAAALLGSLGLRDVVVFGGSSGGIVAVQLALRHPALVRRALVYEPGYLRCGRGGEELHALAVDAVRTHLDGHPRDWAGAYAALARVVEPAVDASPDGFLAPPAGKDWYARREATNSEAMVRDDVPILTAERVDEASLASVPVEVRFAHGSGSPALFHDIATRLAAVRGTAPDVIEDVGHALYVHPVVAAAYVGGHGG